MSHSERVETLEFPLESFSTEGTGKQGLVRMFVLDTNHVSELTYRTAARLRLLQRLDAADQDHLVAEYALSGIGKPIGIAEYQLVRALPEPLDTRLPSIEEIEAELGRIGEEESSALNEKC